MTIEHAPEVEGHALADRKLPPVTEVCIASMALVIVAGIYIAAQLPRHVSLGPSVGLVIAAGVLMLANVATLSRIRDFSWRSFFTVGKWAGLAYLAIGGMLEFIFAFDHTRGATLVLLTFGLFEFSASIALLLAFSVARYQQP